MASQNESGGRPRILVAEDDPDLRRMLELLLRPLGQVVAAVDGQDALDKACEGPAPDVIVTDVMMPHMDGLTLASRLKHLPELAHVPIVILTARSTPREVIAGINAGARFYVTKPFKSEDLVAKVRKALERRK